MPSSLSNPVSSASPLNLPSSSTKAAASAASDRDISMLFIGAACHLGSCKREDFLPFQCANCGEKYCGNHFRPSDHDCSYRLHPEKREQGEQRNFVVPLCPLCTEVPAGWKRGEDAIVAIERHVNQRACSALDARLAESTSQRKLRENRCHYRRCEKIMIVKMECEKCRESFCPSHRAPLQHACRPTENKVSSAKDLSNFGNSLPGLSGMKRLATLASMQHKQGSSRATRTKTDSSHVSADESDRIIAPFGLSSIFSSLVSRKVDK